MVKYLWKQYIGAYNVVRSGAYKVRYLQNALWYMQQIAPEILIPRIVTLVQLQALPFGATIDSIPYAVSPLHCARGFAVYTITYQTLNIRYYTRYGSRPRYRTSMHDHDRCLQRITYKFSTLTLYVLIAFQPLYFNNSLKGQHGVYIRGSAQQRINSVGAYIAIFWTMHL